MSARAGRAWPILATLLAGGCAWLGWFAGGWVAEATGLSVLDMPLRVACVVGVLGIWERVQG